MGRTIVFRGLPTPRVAAQVSRQPQSGAGRNAPPAAHNLVRPGTADAQRQSKLVDAHVQRFHHFFEQHLSRMERRPVPCSHTFIPCFLPPVAGSMWRKGEACLAPTKALCRGRALPGPSVEERIKRSPYQG